MSVIKADHVSIAYKVGSFRDIGLKEFVIRKIKGEYHEENFYAVKDVSFAIEKGDLLSIIGKNGAGKSTLLKVLTGIMEPSDGTVECNGNVSSLLELAGGFDADLTVRENVFLRGALLGYTRKLVTDNYADIIAFSGLEEFQEYPFKQLSSGMKSRLAFSIASLLQPEILILDEVLSVGDGEFRVKSEAKMREIIGSGTTTLLVSHSVQQVRELSTKVLWLDRGRQIEFGDDVTGICDRYEDYLRGNYSIN